jgi:hypothetical protein
VGRVSGNMDGQRTYQETRAWMTQGRFALARQCHPASRFVVNDKGYTPLADPVRELKGVFFPLSGHVGVIMAIGRSSPAMTMKPALSPNASWTRMLSR